jgi:hypothetical protein
MVYDVPRISFMQSQSPVRLRPEYLYLRNVIILFQL